jgi:hypothetical protein
MHVVYTKKLTMMMLFWPKRLLSGFCCTIWWLSIIVFVGCLSHLNVSGALEVMGICHFQSPKFNILFYFVSFETLQEDCLNCQQSTVYSLLLQWRHLYGYLVCLALIGTENGISIMDHGAWNALPWGYIFLHKESVIEAQRSLEKCLLHGNVLFSCNRLSIAIYRNV